MNKRFAFNILCCIGLLSNIKCVKYENINLDTDTYRYTVTHSFRKVSGGVAPERIYFMIPSSNDYQTVMNYDPKNGILKKDSTNNERYIIWEIPDDVDTESGNWFGYSFEFEYIPKSAPYQNHVINDIFPFDTTSGIYRMFTPSHSYYIDTENQAMVNASEEIWRNSTDYYDYAEKCLEYVDNNFSYQDCDVYHPISTIIQRGGGDCANLASVIITLLRIRKIPARYVIVEGHVWAEFYLENYGWIPVDPTFNLFGIAPSGYTGRFVFRNSIVYNVEHPIIGVKNIHSYSTHHFDPVHPHNGYACDINFDREKITNIHNVEVKVEIYPNPVRKNIYIDYQYHGIQLNDTKYKIFNLAGTIIQADRLSGHTIDVSHLNGGLYFLSIDCNGKINNYKIIKEPSYF